MQHPIPTSAKRTATFTPPSLKPIQVEGKDPVGGEKECAFTLRVPTPSERDKLGTYLYELGVTAVSQESIRATLIDDLFNVDWSRDPDAVLEDKSPDGRAAYNEKVAEAKAEFLDGYWSKSQIDEQVRAQWAEQQVQRKLDREAGAKDAPDIPVPERTITVREHAKGKLIVDDMMRRSERLRKIAAEQLDYSRQNGVMMVRLHVLNMIPAHPETWPVELHRGPDGLLTLESVDELREHIGDRAYHELVGAIDGHYELSEEEEKNSGSPLGKPSDPTGSGGLSGDSASSDGSSTASSTTATQSGGSDTTTGKSSASSSGPAKKKGRAGRTGAGS